MPPARICVLVVVSSEDDGGLARVASAVARGLPERGIDTIVALQRDGRAGAVLRRAGIQVHVVPELLETIDRDASGRRSVFAAVRNVGRIRAAVRALRALVRYHGASLIYSHGSWPHHLAAAATRGWARGGPGAVWHVHTAFSRSNALAARVMARRGDVRAVIAVSRSASASYARLGVPMHVIYNGIDLDACAAAAATPCLRDRLSIPRQAFVFGYAGRLVPHKGIEPLTHAAAAVLRRLPQSHFIVLGANPAASRDDAIGRVRRRLMGAGVGDRAHFPGYVDDVLHWLADLDVAVVPSIYADPCPLGVLEACALGVPVIASRIGGIAELIADGRDGWLVPPGDPDALAAALIGAAEDPAARRAAGAAARTSAATRFDERATIDAVASVLTRAAANTPRSSDRPRDPR